MNVVSFGSKAVFLEDGLVVFRADVEQPYLLRQDPFSLEIALGGAVAGEWIPSKYQIRRAVTFAAPSREVRFASRRHEPTLRLRD